MQAERRLLSSEPGPLNLKLQWRPQHRIVLLIQYSQKKPRSGGAYRAL